jgi:ferric-dicitrate binding protein FerR (iron transport regulator)
VKVFPVVIQYLDWKNGGLQSKLIEVQPPLNEAVETLARYIKGTLRK